MAEKKSIKIKFSTILIIILILLAIVLGGLSYFFIINLQLLKMHI